MGHCDCDVQFSGAERPMIGPTGSVSGPRARSRETLWRRFPTTRRVFVLVLPRRNRRLPRVCDPCRSIRGDAGGSRSMNAVTGGRDTNPAYLFDGSTATTQHEEQHLLRRASWITTSIVHSQSPTIFHRPGTANSAASSSSACVCMHACGSSCC
jgi:hypothetical protein